jgi:hypothetical protein
MTTYLHEAVSIAQGCRTRCGYAPRKEDGALVLEGQQRLVEVLHLNRSVEADVQQTDTSPAAETEV